MHGRGLYIWGDGREYNGDWKFNRIDGEGVFKWPDGKKYKGYWENGKQNGEGENYNPRDNVWTKGFWKNGKKQRIQKNEKYNANDLSNINNNKINSMNKYKTGNIKKRPD